MTGARRDLTGAETQDRILDAARALFVEHGIEQTTVRAIAATLGITAPTLGRRVMMQFSHPLGSNLAPQGEGG